VSLDNGGQVRGVRAVGVEAAMTSDRRQGATTDQRWVVVGRCGEAVRVPPRSRTISGR
jgi:hypothetical protein